MSQLALQLEHLECYASCLEAAQVEKIDIVPSTSSVPIASVGVHDTREQVAIAATKASPAFVVQSDAAEEPELTFDDVGGLDKVKGVIARQIILPRTRPDIFRRYKKRAGGGVMLYGPPGCGKTMLARATAGECGLPFRNVRIEEILDPYFGVSESNLHDAFAEARACAPCVLFIDELDAIAFAGPQRQGSVGRALVDQLLVELDSIGSNNREFLILAATNAPWDVDDALLRPGRFDHRIFVPPPARAARSAILQHLLTGIPNAGIDVNRLAAATPLFSGADLVALLEHAVDAVIDEVLVSDDVLPLTQGQLDAARNRLHPTTLDWLARSRNYVEFANQDGRYDEIATFLQSSEARRSHRQYRR